MGGVCSSSEGAYRPPTPVPVEETPREEPARRKPSLEERQAQLAKAKEMMSERIMGTATYSPHNALIRKKNVTVSGEEAYRQREEEEKRKKKHAERLAKRNSICQEEAGAEYCSECRRLYPKDCACLAKKRWLEKKKDDDLWAQKLQALSRINVKELVKKMEDDPVIKAEIEQDKEKEQEKKNKKLQKMKEEPSSSDDKQDIVVLVEATLKNAAKMKVSEHRKLVISEVKHSFVAPTPSRPKQSRPETLRRRSTTLSLTDAAGRAQRSTGSSSSAR